MAKKREVLRICTDRIIPEEERERFAQIALAEDPANAIPGLSQGMMQAMSPDGLFPIRMALVTGKKWANGRTIRVAFLGGTSTQHDYAVRCGTELSEHANLKFEWDVAAAVSDLRISFKPNEGAYSYMGTDCLGIPKNQATTNLGWQDGGVGEHELLHALACIHEHQHPQGGIPWNKPAVYAYYGRPPNRWDRATVDSNIFATYSVGQTQFSAYDRQSVMHYAIPKELLLDPTYAVGWNTTLSATDKKYLAEVYPKAAPPPPPPVEDQMARVSIVGGKLIEAWVGGKKLWPVG